MTTGKLRLVGDIGGTNARFGLAGGGKIDLVKHLAVAKFPTARDGLAHYLAGLPADHRPIDAVLAVAGPVVHGVADLTNAQGWHLNEAELGQSSGLARVKLINDFAAQALAVPALGAQDLRPIGGQSLIDATQTVTLLGPGTGTGVGARVMDGAVAAILVCEGGHIAFAPNDAVEIELLKLLSGRFGRVSVERILAGQGLVNLHQALAQIDGRTAAAATPDGITDAALNGDAHALATLNRFFAILGSVLGDMALVHGAWGGAVLAGGILPRVARLLEESSFRQRFEDKGRMAKLARRIPTNLIVAADVGLLGASLA